ncbi:agmatine deiminase family protein [Endozoicomonas sp. SM1973]|uniref:Agmatine deiminase family protein n=1 Tax=Spartinivicinus marinus TaxID=2994442 RepID=A0A853IAI1_9GAMM|nr:agmatine deiminase family protein [Spartinivicinus marinus]MCX4026602.1 agmatine deiminase family protein [Spartinivicinus marinus]NYZ64436.1 agmatine deiminase family protein [Spartinivicinus marinus]
MITRRAFVTSLGCTALASTLSKQLFAGTTKYASSEQPAWLMPDEAIPHSRTWLSFVAKPMVWGKRHAYALQDTLGKLAKTIAKYEPVTVIVNKEDLALAKQKCGDLVEFMVAPLDDFWIRDHGAVFVKNSETKKLAAVDFNFNGWGNKQYHNNDKQIARKMAANQNIELINTPLILEGGALEVDGEGTAIITESCVLNKNRNPSMTKAQCEAHLKITLGIEKVIWLPGIKGKDITDGHTDFYARFTHPGRVVIHMVHDRSSYEYELTRKHKRILEQATDAKGRKLKLITMDEPEKLREDFLNDDFAAGYVNFYVANKVIIAPEFGDSIADEQAYRILQAEYPNHTIEMLNIDPIAAGGGGIHCSTMQQPVV